MAGRANQSLCLLVAPGELHRAPYNGMSEWEKGLLVVMSAAQKLHEAGLTKKEACGSLPLKRLLAMGEFTLKL